MLFRSALVFHMAVHAAFGAVAAAPTRNRWVIGALACSAMLIDVDHIASFLGWPVPGRGSHSVTFLVLAPVVLGVSARQGWLGRGAPVHLAAAMAFSTVLAHVAWDAVSATESRIPMLLPLESTGFALGGAVAAALEVVAVATMGVAARVEARRTPSAREQVPVATRHR